MYWYQDFFISDNIKGSRKQIRTSVTKGRHLRPWFLVVLSDMPQEQLEIIPVSMLRFAYYQKKNLVVLGVAKGYYYARTMVEQMFSLVYRETGSCDVKQYFQEKIRGEVGE